MVNSNAGDGQLRPNDLGLVFGAAYRFSDDFELGMRNYQSLLPAADMGILRLPLHPLIYITPRSLISILLFPGLTPDLRRIEVGTG